jgi:predicted secreted protein
MSFGSIVAIYFVTWWIVLFAVLPFGVRTQDEAGDVTLGTTASAPVRPRLVRTIIATTIVAGIVVGGMVVAFDVFDITLETFAALLGIGARP